ncbi:MAG: histidine phosphatase family protein [Lachnospiraceae bacterium]|nr:histidine phosphatase family protein [Lachnospiraceae bacterium]
MEILLIRHGKTRGNLEGRYIGRTDEPLLDASREVLQQSPYRDFDPDVIYVSPMRRCRETAEILFGDGCHCKLSGMIIDKDLREMDFGDFENKNYDDLKSEPVYQTWIDVGGRFAFPGGEDPIAFRRRCQEAFWKDIEDAVRESFEKVAFVVHGGTIMSIMEAYGTPKGDFYRWQVKNGEGYHCIVVKTEGTIILMEKETS